MTIFNSFGSNYTFLTALRALFAAPSKKKRRQLIDHLEQRYGGKALLTYKGREAIGLALDAIGAKGSAVAINGFTCFVMYEWIAKCGYGTRYLDISDASLNFSPETLASALDKDASIKVVIIQNTLGYPCDIRTIVQMCKARNIILIEDLAHCVGTQYATGEETGTVGDFTALSFSQDKAVDGISGGALIVRNPAYADRVSRPQERVIFSRQAKDRLYLLVTVIIRTTYASGIGKMIHKMLRSYSAVPRPIANVAKKGVVHDLPNSYCANILRRFENLEKDIAHKRLIAGIYAHELDKSFLREKETADIAHSNCLRFPIIVSDRDNLVAFMRNKGIHIHDTWYEAPLSPKKMLPLSSYAGECPISERTGNRIANLPTHQNVSPESARDRASGQRVASAKYK